MGKRDVQVTQQGGCGAGCVRSLLLLWFLGGLATVLGLPILLGGTNGAGGAAVGVLGSGALVATLGVPWIIGLVVLAILNLVARPSQTVIIQKEQSRNVGPIETEPTRVDKAAISKVCPRCAETVRAAAIICRFCGYNFDSLPDDVTATTKLVAIEVASAAERTSDIDPGRAPTGSASRTDKHPFWSAASLSRNRWYVIGGAALVVLALAFGVQTIANLGSSNTGPTPTLSLGVAPSTEGLPIGQSPLVPSAAPPNATMESGIERVLIATASCPNPYGPLPGQGTPLPLPAQITASVPKAWAEFFTAYVPQDVGWVLAPRGWLCEDSFAGGSGGSTQVIPIDDSHALVSVAYDASYGGSISAAAPYFDSAAELMKQDTTFGNPGSPPQDEVWYALAPDAVYFQDYAGTQGVGVGSGGPYSAQGVLVYRGPSDFIEITCVLPDAQSTLCATILNNFLDQQGMKARV